MGSEDLLSALRGHLVPSRYPVDASDRVGPGQLLLRKRMHLFLAMAFSDVPPGDHRSACAKQMVRSNFRCVPAVWEKGLSVLYYGPISMWGDRCGQFVADKTSMRAVILQSVHFVDPESGANVHIQSRWGSLEFGFCNGLVADIEKLCLTRLP